MDEELEIVTVRATLRTPLPRELRRVAAHRRAAAARDRRASRRGRSPGTSVCAFALVARDSPARRATRSPGPAIVTETTATTYLDAGFVAEVHPSGSLLIARRQRA